MYHIENTYENTGWKDKLVSYDGVNITYDSMGNPTRYIGHSLKWDRVRLLTQWDNIEIAYNASGIRTRKGDTYYELDGDSTANRKVWQNQFNLKRAK